MLTSNYIKTNNKIKVNKMKKRIESILNINGLISLEREDFGDLKTIKFFETVEIDDINDFNFKFINQNVKDIKTIIVHIFSNETMKIEETSIILDTIKQKFNKSTNIIFGTSINKNIKKIVVDVFAKI